jgi:tetratricopeptide (TPR) repeat protein
MKQCIVRIAAITLTLGLPAMAQENIPCPAYQDRVSRVDVPFRGTPAIKDVELCLDDEESPRQLESLRRIKSRTPADARKELELGVDAAHRGLDEDARQHFIEAVQIDPFYWEGLAHLGAVMVRLHQPSQALEILLRAIMIDPQPASTHSNMAWATLLLGNPGIAEGYARRGVMLAPSSEAANYVLGWALILQAPKSPEALSALSVAKRRFSDASKLMQWSEVYSKRPDR